MGRGGGEKGEGTATGEAAECSTRCVPPSSFRATRAQSRRTGRRHSQSRCCLAVAAAVAVVAVAAVAAAAEAEAAVATCALAAPAVSAPRKLSVSARGGAAACAGASGAAPPDAPGPGLARLGARVGFLLLAARFVLRGGGVCGLLLPRVAAAGAAAGAGGACISHSSSELSLTTMASSPLAVGLSCAAERRACAPLLPRAASPRTTPSAALGAAADCAFDEALPCGRRGSSPGGVADGTPLDSTKLHIERRRPGKRGRGGRNLRSAHARERKRRGGQVLGTRRSRTFPFFSPVARSTVPPPLPHRKCGPSVRGSPGSTDACSGHTVWRAPPAPGTENRPHYAPAGRPGSGGPARRTP